MPVDVAFTIELQSPLVVRSHRESRVSDAVEFMPGSTLRGALAWAWRREFGVDGDFKQLFLSSENHFPFLYPGGPESLPYPLTAVSCKRHGGPLSAGGHGVVDTLLVRAGLKGRIKEKRGLKELLECAECREACKPYSGYQSDIDTRSTPLARAYRMGVGIEEATGGAAPRILFGQVGLEPFVRAPHQGEAFVQQRSRGRGLERAEEDRVPTVLGGVGRLKEDHLELLQRLADPKDGSPPPLLFAGAARSRGFGQFRLRLEPYTPDSPLSERLSDFGYQQEQKGLFALTLASDAILVDRFLRNATDLSAALPKGLQEAKLLCQYAKTRIVSGYNVLTRLPKEDEVAICAGSVLVGQSDLPPQELEELLEGVESEGIGVRRQEGFGRVVVCSPFHVKTPARFLKREPKKKEPKKKEPKKRKKKR